MQRVYSGLFRLILPFVLLRLWWMARRTPGLLDHWPQRLGYVRDVPSGDVIWIHAVSVGETLAAAPLVRRLLEVRPDFRVLMTGMTATGADRVRALFGDRVQHVYAPYDSPGSVRRFLDRVQPCALVIMETELWPNMIVQTHQRQIPIFLINARLSERSARGYSRVPSLMRDLLPRITWIAAQASSDAQRFLSIGADPARLSVVGSVKFDMDVTPDQRACAHALRQSLGGRGPVWIAGSTHEGEDELVLEAHRQLLARFPHALLILVPRHPERFGGVAVKIKEAGFRLARRSQDERLQDAQVCLGDTMGELMMLYGVADVAFVGGSLIERGGHNPLEPAAWSRPVLTGPHTFNFERIYAQLFDHGGCQRVVDATSLMQAIHALTDDPGQAARMGQAARAMMDENRGALDRVMARLFDQL
ncbi:MAG: lipid IV(A) 3-deoxy-D-manno-octulosonic acid transferase, partial [Gammaproteobacteria bacterium]|nr:lipid IV(A) 3-deoxy-D-manno-octulosonic acid transferase [Gammaproteobacteria bacterium]